MPASVVVSSGLCSHPPLSSHSVRVSFSALCAVACVDVVHHHVSDVIVVCMWLSVNTETNSCLQILCDGCVSYRLQKTVCITILIIINIYKIINK